ncbi:hypothetical protein QO209_16825 [Pseudomonas citronellolis]|uniref:hypothetical protein n=1 Tax=Pseudomonas citronellolis TaxID=53408 RepID=UPI002649C803|nr:hypothetical protein [Pseudomonas citronellolis]MDN6874108.1 hypothetical protein [Pseudomonas citronellolis]
MSVLIWADAPDWATHIMGDSDDPEIQVWAEFIEGDYYSELWRESRLASFAMAEDDCLEGGWIVVSARPEQQKAKEVEA